MSIYDSFHSFSKGLVPLFFRFGGLLILMFCKDDGLRQLSFLAGLNDAHSIIYSSIAQSVERMTVNHDVTGSSPVRGAISREWIYPKIYSFLIC